MVLWIVILFTFVQLSIGVNYTCDPNLSCGCSISSTTVNRIVNGEAAQPDAWGWAVSLQIQSTYICGGSILSDSWIITAAHCVRGVSASNVTVYAGSIFRWYGNQFRNASRIVVHPYYNSTTYINDIALIKLASPFQMNNTNLRTVCLPAACSLIFGYDEWPVVNASVVAVGWGRLASNGSIATSLQQVTLQIIGYQTASCNSLINDRSVQLCAGVYGGGKDTCGGDSGGPLMVFSSSNQWVLIGLTSYGIGCALPAYSGIYTRVAAFNNWINSTMSTGYIQISSIYYIFILSFLSILLSLKR